MAAYEIYREKKETIEAIEIEFRRDLDKLIKKNGLMNVLVDFLQGINDEYLDTIYFTRSMECVDETLIIGNITIRISSNGYIDILNLSDEQKEELKTRLTGYRFR